MTAETDVIIIGAGSSGLSAAKELTRLGHTITVIEGSHRIGGRAYSEEISPGVWFDLGCSYLHQGEINPFVPIADELGVVLGKDQADLFEIDKITLRRNGYPLNSEEIARHNRYKAGCNATIMAAAERGEDVAIANLVDLESEFAIPYTGGMASLNAQDIDQISTIDFASSGNGSNIPVLNGYGNLIAAWGADVPVSLNTRVERIDWSGSGVIVETPNGTIKGSTVLSTVSNGVLASGDILFSPTLPDWKTQTINNLPTGTMNKICVHFDADVFGEDGRGFCNTWNDDGNAAGIEASVMGLNTAVVFIGGRHAIWLEKQGQQAGHGFAVDRIADVFGSDIRKHVTRSIVTAWTSEPWTRGSYSSAQPGHGHQRVELARPIDERLFFAGEATIVGHQATCHGAYLSGIRAAQEIATTLA